MSSFAFDAAARTRAEAVALGRKYAEDGEGRFVFMVDGVWYVSRIFPHHTCARHVECVIPEGCVWSAMAHYHA